MVQGMVGGSGDLGERLERIGSFADASAGRVSGRGWPAGHGVACGGRSTPLVFKASFELRVRLFHQQLALAGEL
jgi:hypothetical protein